MKCKEKIEMENIVGIDYLRIFAAILITILHLKPTLSLDADITFYITNAITRVGVPVFFLITGFLYSAKGKSFGDKQVVLKHVRRMAILYCAWTIICSPMIIYDFIVNPKYAGMSIAFKSAIFVRRFLLIGSYTPLWFFLAGIYATLLLWLLEKFQLSKVTILVFLGGMTFWGACLNDCYMPLGAIPFGSYEQLQVSMDRWHRYVGMIWEETAWGGFYMYLGYCVQGKIVAKNRAGGGKTRLYFALILFTLLLLGEVALLKGLGATAFSKMVTIMPIAILFIILFDSHGRKWTYNPYIRKLSVLIYGFHIFTSFFLNERIIINSFIRYGANIISTLILSMIVIVLSKRIKILENLY